MAVFKLGRDGFQAGTMAISKPDHDGFQAGA
jgi:hypothetical protein